MKPILFNTDMVRRLLNGTKTVTRRVVKLKYSNTHLEMRTDKCGTRLIEIENEIPGVTRVKNPDGTITLKVRAFIERTPPYRPGDILYVRETWQHGFGGTYLYRASAGHDLFMTADGKLVSDIPWHPSIHMPRDAARIFLRGTDVRVERLQDITPEQAQAEGTEPFMMTADVDKPDEEKRWQEMLPALSMFPALWDSTIKKADRVLYGWEANPYVWVIEFDRCGKPEGGT